MGQSAGFVFSVCQIATPAERPITVASLKDARPRRARSTSSCDISRFLVSVVDDQHRATRAQKCPVVHGISTGVRRQRGAGLSPGPHTESPTARIVAQGQSLPHSWQTAAPLGLWSLRTQARASRASASELAKAS